MPKKPKHPAKVVPLKKSKCPNCAKPAVAEHRPFCCQRCADLDLGRWFNGKYRIPTNETPGEGAWAEGDDDDD